VNELLARAGSLFLAPAPTAATARPPAAPADLVGVLAPSRDLAVVAGGVAADLRRRHRAKAVLVCASGSAPAARLLAGRAARALASRLAARELPAVAAGGTCRMTLPDDPDAAVQTAWRAVTAAGGVPAVVALAERTDAADGLLAQVDLLLLATRADTEPAYAQLALASLAALGPPADAVRVPTGLLARRSMAIGAAALRVEAVPA
jgi:hypothetical protein